MFGIKNIVRRLENIETVLLDTLSHPEVSPPPGDKWLSPHHYDPEATIRALERKIQHLLDNTAVKTSQIPPDEDPAERKALEAFMDKFFDAWIKKHKKETLAYIKPSKSRKAKKLRPKDLSPAEQEVYLKNFNNSSQDDRVIRYVDDVGDDEVPDRNDMKQIK